jgi:antitoxin VapB
MLNIKNPETHRLASELAALTGVTMTEAVTAALREKLATLQAAASKEEQLKRVMEIADRCAPLLQSISSADIDALYDNETGLPK